MFIWMRISSDLVGEIERVDDTAVVTKFTYVNFMPFVPEATFVRYQRAGESVPTFVPIPMVARSAIAGYLPRWGAAAGVLLGFMAFIKGADGELGVSAIGAVLAVLVAFGARAVAARLGHLSADERARRRIYAAWIGPAIDPRLCGKQLDPWIDQVRGFVALRAREVVAAGYRSTPDNRKAWFEAALKGDDLALLGAALTLACADLARTRDRAELAELTATHAALWARLAPRAGEAAEVPGLSLSNGVAPVPGKACVEPPPLAPRVGFALGGAIALSVAGYFAYDYAHPMLYAFNATARQRVVFSVDGAPLADAGGYSPQLVERRRVSLGRHVLEVRDPQSGAVLDRQEIDLHLGDRGLVYAPARPAGTCVLVQHVVYAATPSTTERDESQLLDPGASAWAISRSIDYPFSEPPERLQLSQHSSTETRWALRMVKCKPAAAGAPGGS